MARRIEGTLRVIYDVEALKDLIKADLDASDDDVIELGVTTDTVGARPWPDESPGRIVLRNITATVRSSDK